MESTLARLLLTHNITPNAFTALQHSVYQHLTPDQLVDELYLYIESMGWDVAHVTPTEISWELGKYRVGIQLTTGLPIFSWTYDDIYFFYFLRDIDTVARIRREIEVVTVAHYAQYSSMTVP